MSQNNIQNSNTKKQIIAYGGASFQKTSLGENLLHKYTLEATGKKYPKIAFVPTASGDSQAYINMFYNGFSKLDCHMSHLNLFLRNHLDLESYLLNQDVIYVGGGNTYNMLLLWKNYGIDQILRQAYQNGTVLCGGSAGSICWFEAGNTDSFGKMDKIEAMGFLEGSHSPHYSQESLRRPNFHKLIETKQIPEGYGVDNGVAMHYVDGKIHSIVSQDPEGKAYKVSIMNNKVQEEVINPDLLK